VPTNPSVVILGAGMSGICMGILLKRAGFEDFTIVERSTAVGGTWWDNVYPGVQCDVHSQLYSFSFKPTPDWSRTFATGAEIRAYAERCVDQYDLRRHLRLGTTLREARYEPARGGWHLTTTDGESLQARVFVCSVGPLNRPRMPPGLAAFQGEVMHSARWNRDFDFAHKRVALIGSAASAIQIAPELATRAARLSIFQRSPSWILPRPDRTYGHLARRLLRVWPIGRASRYWQYWLHDVRYAAFRGHGPLYRVMVGLADRHRVRQVRDPQLCRSLRPSYPMGCKRVLISSGFYPTLGRPNVELIQEAAESFEAGRVVGARGTVREVDAIVCATGFEATTLMPDLRVVGLAGRELASAASDGADAYRGISVPGFPNLFLLLGPNTGGGHTSALIPIEAQAAYIVRCVRRLARNPGVSLDVKRSAEEAYNRRIQDRLARTVWTSPACTSWYKTPSGKVVGIYPGPVTRYVLEMRRPDFSAYDSIAMADD